MKLQMESTKEPQTKNSVSKRFRYWQRYILNFHRQHTASDLQCHLNLCSMWMSTTVNCTYANSSKANVSSTNDTKKLEREMMLLKQWKVDKYIYFLTPHCYNDDLLLKAIYISLRGSQRQQQCAKSNWSAWLQWNIIRSIKESRQTDWKQFCCWKLREMYFIFYKTNTMGEKAFKWFGKTFLIYMLVLGLNGHM